MVWNICLDFNFSFWSYVIHLHILFVGDTDLLTMFMHTMPQATVNMVFLFIPMLISSKVYGEMLAFFIVFRPEKTRFNLIFLYESPDDVGPTSEKTTIYCVVVSCVHFLFVPLLLYFYSCCFFVIYMKM